MKIIAKNKRALKDYKLLEKLEAGIVLYGHEVKSAKTGNVSLKGSYVIVGTNKKGQIEASVKNMHISAYEKAGNIESYDPVRTRSLLLNKRELKTLIGKKQSEGLTIIPTSLYTKGSFVKLGIALARGKKKQDKREDIKQRESNRRIARTLKNR